MMDLFLIVVAIPASIASFVAARRVFRYRWPIGPPNFLAAPVAALTFLGITGRYSGVFAVIVLPYAVFGLSVLALYLVPLFLRLKSPFRRREAMQGQRGAEELRIKRGGGPEISEWPRC